MKKWYILFMVMFLFLSLTTIQVKACSCAPINVDQVINSDRTYFFYGTVKEKLSNNVVIFEVKENYSKKPINQYIVLYSTNSFGPSCGISFENWGNNNLFVIGEFNYGKKTYMKLSSCSIRGINKDGYVHYLTLNDEDYDKMTVSELRVYINKNIYAQPIQNNSLNITMINGFIASHLFYILIGGIVIINIIIFIYLKKRKWKHNIN